MSGTQGADAGGSYAQRVAEALIEQLERGTAPWLKPWNPGERYMPYNGVTGAEYHGINAVWLSAMGQRVGYQDTRWLTYKQAAGLGAQVRRSEHGTKIEFWKWRDTQPVLDSDGKPVTGLDGQPLTTTVEYERPRVWRSTVFNAEQIDGLAPPETRVLAPEWERHELAEKLLFAGNTDLRHAPGDRAFYSYTEDRIVLPLREQFASADRYYSVALHEKSHWSGHSSRLDRDMAHPFGSEAYAREELRAEIASLILGDKLGIGHDPGQHAAYVDSWIKVLRKDPREVFRAAAEAERITGYILGLGREQTQEQAAQDRAVAPSTSVEVHIMPVEQEQAPAAPTAAERVYLAVPYAEKDAAKSFGARWDRTAKAWYAPPGAALAEFQRWMPAAQAQTAAVSEDPRDAFAEALRAAGFELSGPPVMDGRLQRARVMGDTGAQRSGAYTGYLDGRPSGFIQNHKTGLKTTWTAVQAPQAVVDRATMAAEAAEKRKQREAELEQQYLIAGENAERIWASAALAEAHPYLARKGVQAHGTRVATPAAIAEADRLYPPEDGRPGHAYSAGDLLVPVRGPDGALWTLQAIRDDGRKGFGKGGRLAGGSFTIGDLDQAGPLVIAEGFATGATLHELTGQPVAVAFNAGNLGKVAEAYRAQFPDRPLVVAGDNDHQAPRQPGPDGQPRKNVGAEKAREAAAAVQGFALLPAFDETSRGTDWNDLTQEQGIETASGLLAEGLGRATLQRGGLTAERAETVQQVVNNRQMEKNRERELAQERTQDLSLGR